MLSDVRGMECGGDSALSSVVLLTAVPSADEYRNAAANSGFQEPTIGFRMSHLDKALHVEGSLRELADRHQRPVNGDRSNCDVNTRAIGQVRDRP